MYEIKCPHCQTVFSLEDATGYSALLKQLRDDEFNRDLSKAAAQQETDKAAALKLAAAQAEQAKTAALAQQQQQIAALNLKVMELEKDKELAVSNALAKQQTVIADKEKQIVTLRGQVDTAKQQGALDVQSLKNEYEAKLKVKDTEIALYKEMKSKMSVKLLGETLEQHCQIEFEKLRATAFKRAEFNKDNDSKTGSEGEAKGSKGDFIFRDFDDQGNEYISIMFDMKNESDATTTKHKNEDFLKKLDEDRRKKNCEYAILVSLLEQDSELYNAGIVDVSHKYPKMFVIRPQCFIPMITLLRDAAQNTIDYRKQVVQLQRANIDVSNFEAEMDAFKDAFSKNCKDAGDRYEEAIKNINDIIAKLESTKEALRKWHKHLGTAENRLTGLTIKKLTQNNPTMAAKFAQASQSSAPSTTDENDE